MEEMRGVQTEIAQGLGLSVRCGVPRDARRDEN